MCKIKLSLLILVVFLASCASKLPVRPLGDYLKHRGECKLDSKTDFGKMMQPIYPAKAAKNWQEGWVVLKFDIVSGKPRNVVVVDSSPTGIFEDSAISALENSTYKIDTKRVGCISIREFNISRR